MCRLRFAECTSHEFTAAQQPSNDAKIVQHIGRGGAGGYLRRLIEQRGGCLIDRPLAARHEKPDRGANESSETDHPPSATKRDELRCCFEFVVERVLSQNRLPAVRIRATTSNREACDERSRETGTFN